MQDVPKCVLNRLQKTSAVAEAHPEANLLTAFAEHSLADRERDRVIRHLARCGDCREIVTLALPADEAIAVQSFVRGSGSSWFSWPMIRWGVVAAGIVLISSAGILQYEHRHRQDAALVTNVAVQVATQNEKPAASAPSVPSASHPSVPGEAVALVKKAELRKKTTLRAETDGVKDHPIETASNAQSQFHGGLVQNQAVNGSEARSSTNFNFVAKAKDPVPAQSSSSGLIPMVAPPAIPLQTSPALMLRASPRWNVSPAGALQRSFDAGKTWENVNVVSGLRGSQSRTPAGDEGENSAREGTQSNSTPVFRAVAAIGPEVWAGGLAAMLYRSVDSGTRWTKVLPAAQGAVLTGDIMRIEFSDLQHGRIATSAREVWSTTDSGQSWSREQ